MPETSGDRRPGGRTARTRQAVHAATRALLEDPEAPLTIPAIAERSGVHATTVYRRWGTVESIVLDLAVERVVAESAVPATGDLRADLTDWVARLLRGLRERSTGTLLQALLAAGRTAGTPSVAAIVEPRVRQLQAMLDAAGVTAIDGTRLTELVLAPAYLWTLVGAPLDPAADTERLVDAVLALAGGGRSAPNGGSRAAADLP